MWCVSRRKQAKVCKRYQTQLEKFAFCITQRISLLIIIMLRFVTHLLSSWSPNHTMICDQNYDKKKTICNCLLTFLSYDICSSPCLPFLSCHPLSSLPLFSPFPFLLSCLANHRSRPREFTPSLPTSPPLQPTSLPPRTHSPQTSVACRSHSRPRPPVSEPSPTFPANTNDSRHYTAPQAPWRSAISAGSSWDRPSP